MRLLTATPQLSDDARAAIDMLRRSNMTTHLALVLVEHRDRMRALAADTSLDQSPHLCSRLQGAAQALDDLLTLIR